MNFKRKAVSLLLTTALIFQLGVPAMAAAEPPDISPEALRVSDEFVAAYPNGLIEFATAGMEAEENADIVDFYIARRGGTDGTVTVRLKAIETVAKYGVDFELLTEGFLGANTVEKGIDSPTILEGSIVDTKDEPITADPEPSAEPEPSADPEPSVDPEPSADPESSADPEPPEPPVEQSYASTLHALKDKVLGQSTVSDQVTGTDTLSLFGIENQENIDVTEATNTILPGATIDLTFAPGENYKRVQVRVIDDAIHEDDETFTLGLYEIEGAVLGDAISANVILHDNDAPAATAGISFAEDCVVVQGGERTARFKLLRIGTDETYLPFRVATMADTALSGTHYVSLVTDGVLLPGQNYKYIDVPILGNETEETLSFSLTATADSGDTATATAELLPQAAPQKLSRAAASRPSISIDMGKPYWTGNNDSVQYTWQQNGKSVWTIKLDNASHDTEGRTQYGLGDTRGISEITAEFAVADCKGKTSSHESNVYIEWIPIFHQKHNVPHAVHSFTNFTRQEEGHMEFRTSSWYENSAVMHMVAVTLYPQRVSLVSESADRFNVNIYEGNKKPVNIYKSNVIPGQITFANMTANRGNEFYRDDVVKLNVQLTPEGTEYGCYLSGYQLKDPKTGTYKSYSGDTLTLTPEIMEAYAASTQDGAAFTVKPIFERRMANGSISVGNYLSSRGTIQIDGNTWTANQTDKYWFTLPWKVGDRLLVKTTPEKHYASTGIVNAEGQPFEEKNLPANTFYAVFGQSPLTIIPLFARTDCGVLLKNGSNADKLYVFHDQNNSASQNELSLLYKNTQGLTGDALNAKIKGNYDAARGNTEFQNNRTLSNLTIGDVVTLYAESKDPNYIPYWELGDTSGATTTTDQFKFAKHYGESFTFTVDSNETTVNCGLERKNATTNYVLSGKTVQVNNTLKSTIHYDKVNLNDPSSYIPVSDVAMGVMSFDARKSSFKDEKGIVYSTSVTSDSGGNFKLYVPSVSKNELFSVKYLNGEQVRSQILVATDKEIYIEVPFRDPNYTVQAIQCTQIVGTGSGGKSVAAEKNGALEIPYIAADGARTFTIQTQTARGSHKISAVKLNSYSPAGALIAGIAAAPVTGSANLWTVNANLNEILTPNGKLTVEVFDATGKSHGEVQTGYLVTKEPPKTSIKTPATGSSFANSGSTDIPGTGTSVPTVPDASFEGQVNKDMELAVLTGTTMRTAIVNNLEQFESKSAMEKLVFLTGSLGEQFSVNVSKAEKTNTKFPILFDFGLYMKMGQTTDINGKTEYTLDYAFVTVALKASANTELSHVIYGVPVYLSLSATGYGRGVIGFMGQSKTFTIDSICTPSVVPLLGLYGHDQIPAKFSETDLPTQQLLGLLYNMGNMQKAMMPKENAATIDVSHRQHVAERLTAVVKDTPGLYCNNKALFANFAEKFSENLNTRLKKYTSTISTNADGSYLGSGTLDNDWIQEMNLMLLTESLPFYLQPAKTVIKQADSFSLDKLSNIETAGIITLQPRFSIGVGIGKRGVLSLGVSGHIDFILNYMPWEDGRGTVTFALNADLDVLIIPLSIRIIATTLEMFKSAGYKDNAFDYEKLGASGIFAPKSSTYALLEQSMKEGLTSGVKTDVARISGDNSLQAQPMLRSVTPTPPGDNSFGVNEFGEHYMETTKHPEPQLFALEDGKKILFYVNDNAGRDTYDRNSIYCAAADSGGVWGASTELEADGTLDGDLATLKLPDGRIAVAWTNANKTFGNDLPDMANVLTAQNISVCIFDADGTAGAITDLTADGKYSYSMPTLTYDPTSGELLVAYKMTDYHTDGVDFDYGDVAGTYANFFANSYSTLAYNRYKNGVWLGYDGGAQDAAYRALEEKTGESLGGMRFITAGIPGLENPNIEELSAGTYDGKAYLSYILDTDGKRDTLTDRELFALRYDYGTGSFFGPIQLTDDLRVDANPQLVTSPHVNSLYYGTDGAIAEIPLTRLTAENAFTSRTEGAYHILTALLDESYHPETASIIGYENADAAQSFAPTLADNGCLYLLWNESSSVRDTETNKDHDQRNLFMQMYDPQFTLKEIEGEEPIYIGSWGLPGKVTEDVDIQQNEVTMVVSPQDKYTLAWRQYRMEEQKSTTDAGDVIYTTEPDLSTMFVSEFELYSTIAADENSVSVFPAYPASGDMVALSYRAKNFGNIPSESVQFNYYLVSDDETLIDTTDEHGRYWDSVESINKEILEPMGFALEGAASTCLDAKAVDVHIKTDGTLSDSVSFLMPGYKQNARLYVLAWEGMSGGTTIDFASCIPIELPIAPSIVLHEVTSALSADKTSIRISGSVTNNGNAPALNPSLDAYSLGAYNVGSLVLSDTVDGAAAAEQANTEVGKILLNAETEDAVTSALAPGESCTFELVLSDEEAARAAIRRPISKMFDTNGVAEFDLGVSYEETADVQSRAAIRRKGTSVRTSVQKTEESTLGLQAITVGAADAPNPRSRFAQGTDVPAVSVYTGETKSMNLKMEPYGSDTQYQLTYQSDHPEIASVDPSTGEITGHKAGSAQITLTATKPGTGILFAGADGTISRYSGTKITHNEDGTLNNLPTEAAETVTVMEQLVAVTVTNAPTPPEDSGSGNSGTTVKNPDGSTTTTVTDKRTGAVTETTKFPDGTKIETITAKDGVVTAKVTVPKGKDEVSITIPVKNPKPSTVAVIVHPDGREEIVRTCVPTKDGISLNLSQSASLKIIENGKLFDDVAQTDWFAEAVDFVSARELFNGTSATMFSSKADMSRAMLFTVLARMDGQDTTGGETYYSKAMEWAKAEGISDGTNPDGSITREQLAAMLYRYAGSPAASGNLEGFTDADKVSDWAANALRWAVSAGLVSGKGNGILDPLGKAARAEVATMLMRYLKNGLPNQK